MTDRQAWRLQCPGLPPGHWHCRHGHVLDCPEPTTCPRMREETPTHVVAAGVLVYLFSDRTRALRTVGMLESGGAKVSTWWGITDDAVVQRIIADLPGRTIEDVRDKP